MMKILGQTTSAKKIGINKLYNQFSALRIPFYLRDTYTFKLKTRVKEVDDLKGFVLQDTIFHPQGGGQPKDKGWIVFESERKEIVDARVERESGKIWYQANESTKWHEGDEVEIEIDGEVRKRNAILHSAGHLIDLAVEQLRYNWITAKGYHFQKNPYVEYLGQFQDLERKKTQINSKIQELLKSQIGIEKIFYSFEEAIEKGLITKEFKVAMVSVIKFGKSECPCGGTHIESIKDIERLQIRKVQKKGKFIRVSYSVQ